MYRLLILGLATTEWVIGQSDLVRTRVRSTQVHNTQALPGGELKAVHDGSAVRSDHSFSNTAVQVLPEGGLKAVHDGSMVRKPGADRKHALDGSPGGEIKHAVEGPILSPMVRSSSFGNAAMEVPHGGEEKIADERAHDGSKVRKVPKENHAEALLTSTQVEHNLQPDPSNTGNLPNLVRTRSTQGLWNWQVLPAGERVAGFVRGAVSIEAFQKILVWQNVILCTIWAGISVVILASLASHFRNGVLRELQVLKVQVLMALIMLSICGTLTSLSMQQGLSKMALRYLIEGYLLYVVVYAFPATMSSYMDTAQAEEERNQKAKELAQSNTPASDPLGETPPLLLAAVKQLEDNPEEQPCKTPITSTPAAIWFLVLVCFLRPALNVFAFFASSYWRDTPTTQFVMSQTCFVANMLLSLLGLTMARVNTSRISKYVMWYPSISIVVKILPFLGTSQDFALGSFFGSDGLGTTLPGLVYLLEVSLMLFFVAYKFTPGKTLLEQLRDEEPADETHQSWLSRMLDPRNALCRRKQTTSANSLRGRQKAIRDKLMQHSREQESHLGQAHAHS